MSNETSSEPICSERVVIRRGIEHVFAVIADLSGYGTWLPPSSAFVGVRSSGHATGLGTRYVDEQRFGVAMPGVVEAYDPPRRIVFRQGLRLRGHEPVDVEITYALRPVAGGTEVVRRQRVELPGALGLLRGCLRPLSAAEGRRILKRLEARCEREGGDR